jgi:predicted nucleotidyltransferase
MYKIGNQHHYQANPRCPIYAELIAIVKKTVGLTEPIREALSPLSKKIDWAFVFGSVASGKESSASDIDLMIIGDVSFSEVANTLYSMQEALGREERMSLDNLVGISLERTSVDAGVISRLFSAASRSLAFFHS